MHKNSRSQLGNPFPCDECAGYGKNYDPADRDSYEGYKMASRRVTCTKCGGTGKLDEKYWRRVYNKEKTKRKLEIELWDQIYKDFKSIILSKCQWDAIYFFEGKRPKKG